MRFQLASNLSQMSAASASAQALERRLLHPELKNPMRPTIQDPYHSVSTILDCPSFARRPAGAAAAAG